jgi:sugar phosphate isomerase/epimerase
MAERLLSDGLKHVLELADKHKVNVGIECEPGLFVEYAEELKHWIERMGHPRLGANLDVGHSQVIGEDIPTVVRLLKGRIWNLHIEDIPGRKHYHLIPGEGTLDWAGLKSALADIHYDRFATVELYTYSATPHEAAEKSFAFLSGLFDRT